MSVHEVLNFFPTTNCVTPLEAQRLYEEEKEGKTAHKGKSLIFKTLHSLNFKVGYNYFYVLSHTGETS